MQHWSRPLAPTDHDRAPRLRAAPPWGPVLPPRATLDLAHRLLRHVRNAAVTRWEDAAERHGVAALSFRTRALAAGLGSTVALAMLAALVMRGPGEIPAAATPLTGADPVSTLRLELPAAASGAGPESSAPAAGVAADGPTTPGLGAPPTPVTARPKAPNLLPTGKGMWFHMLDQTGMTPEQIVERARAAGLTHVYLRLGSSRKGFQGQADLDRFVPAAHAGGLKVVGWDFPYLDDPNGDIARALEEITYTTPDGHRIDAFSADIETGTEGVALAADRVEYYAANVRYYAGPGYPLIGTVPNACLNNTYPYVELARHFDALAPMVYWITRDPSADLACNLERLLPLGRPVMPIGQAYDPAIDNPTLVNLVPGYDQLSLFMRVAAERGAAGVSFWAWHTATDDMWRAVTDAPWFTLVPIAPGRSDPDRVAVLQRLLATYGYSVPVDGQYGSTTVGALAQLQADLGLPPTGTLDEATVRTLTARG